MLASTITITTALAASIPIDHVTVERSTNSAHVFGYTHDGEVAAEIAVWQVEGEPRLAVTLPDGSYLFASLRDGEAMIDTNDRDAIAAQLAEMSEVMDISAEIETTGWVDCGLEAVGAAGACAVVVAYFGCVVGTIAAACTCLPLLVEEFEDLDCPGFG